MKEVPEKRMSDELPPTSKTMRYDRQLRLWGDEGQSALEGASVCLLNATTLGCEILKNLVLPGIGEIHIVDDSRVTSLDIQSNFFLTPRDLGGVRCECVAKTISQLNPDTKHAVYNSSVADFIQSHLDELKRFSVFVVSNLHPATYRDLAQIAWDSNIPLVITKIVGMYTEVRVVVREHCIIDTKPDTPLPDLRLDKPFTELIDFYQNQDFSAFSPTEHAHIPFVLILLKCLDQWKAEHGGEIPKTYQQKTEFKSLIKALRWKPDEENFAEALQNVNKCIVASTLPAQIKQLFDDACCRVTASSGAFWVTAAAVKQFCNVKGVLPVSGMLDDMTADSQSFIALQTLYRNKAASDADIVMKYVQQYLSKFSIPPEYISKEYVAKFSRNARFVQVLRTGPAEGCKSAVKSALETFHDEKDDLSHVVLLFEACAEFVSKHSRWPGDTDATLDADEVELTSLLAGVQQKYSLPDIKPVLYVKDFVRYGGTETPSVAAFTGGIAAHECIKLITGQFIPIDNCLVYSGGSQQTAVYKF